MLDRESAVKENTSSSSGRCRTESSSYSYLVLLFN
jgi:hypothetical protein